MVSEQSIGLNAAKPLLSLLKTCVTAPKSNKKPSIAKQKAFRSLSVEIVTALSNLTDDLDSTSRKNKRPLNALFKTREMVTNNFRKCCHQQQGQLLTEVVTELSNTFLKKIMTSIGTLWQTSYRLAVVLYKLIKWQTIMPLLERQMKRAHEKRRIRPR